MGVAYNSRLLKREVEGRTGLSCCRQIKESQPQKTPTKKQLPKRF
jgi:hypothetical protein